MAYEPLQYPTFQFAVPRSPLQGAVEAYSTGLGLAQQKQQMEMQKQQLAMQQQQMGMQQERLGMEKAQEARSAERFGWERTDKEKKQALEARLTQVAKDAMAQGKGVIGALIASRDTLLQEGDIKQSFEMTKDALDTVVKRIPDPVARAEAMTAALGTQITPEQAARFDASKHLQKDGSILITDAQGNILGETPTEFSKKYWKQEQLDRAMKQEQINASREAQLQAAKARASGDSAREMAAVKTGFISLAREVEQIKSLEVKKSRAETASPDLLASLLQAQGLNISPNSPDARKVLIQTYEDQIAEKTSAVVDGYDALTSSLSPAQLEAALRVRPTLRSYVERLRGQPPAPGTDGAEDASKEFLDNLVADGGPAPAPAPGSQTGPASLTVAPVTQDSPAGVQARIESALGRKFTAEDSALMSRIGWYSDWWKPWANDPQTLAQQWNTALEDYRAGSLAPLKRAVQGSVADFGNLLQSGQRAVETLKSAGIKAGRFAYEYGRSYFP